MMREEHPLSVRPQHKHHGWKRYVERQHTHTHGHTQTHTQSDRGLSDWRWLVPPERLAVACPPRTVVPHDCRNLCCLLAVIVLVCRDGRGRALLVMMGRPAHGERERERETETERARATVLGRGRGRRGGDRVERGRRKQRGTHRGTFLAESAPVSAATAERL